MKKNQILVIGIVILLGIVLTLVATYAYDFKTTLMNSNITRVADNSTVDSYKTFFNTTGTRYDGRIWSDKSVYSYNDTEGKVTLDNGLSYLNSGNGFDIDYDADFLNVFSALGSSQLSNRYSPVPIDMVFVVDISGSMSGERIQKTVTAINKTINTLMLNENNRVGIAVFGTTGAKFFNLVNFVPEPGKTDTEWLKSTDSSTFTLTVSGKVRTLNTDGTWNVYNDIEELLGLGNNQVDNGSSSSNTNSVGGGTNIQAGIVAGMDILAQEKVTTFTPNASKTESGRIPVIMIMTDGSSSSINTSNDGISENSWWNANYDSSSSVVGDTPKIISQTLMSAAYGMAKIDNNYKLSTPIAYGINVDASSNNSQANAILNPSEWFKKDTSDSTIKGAYDYYDNWVNSNKTVSGLAQLPSGHSPTKQEVIDHIHYIATGNFFNISSGELENVFSKVIETTSRFIFQPIEGDNIGNNGLSYVDPIGEYLEVKDFSGLLLFGKKYNIVKGEEKEESGITYTYYKAVDSSGNDISIINHSYDIYDGDKKVNSDVSFKLSDIKIWVERDKNNEETLHITIPSNAIPVRVNIVSLEANQSVRSYESNKDSVNSLPIRILYTVGLSDELTDQEGKIDLTKISKEYLENNKKYLDGKNYISLYDSSYSKSSVDGAYTIFSPSGNNLFYIFQDHLTIYKTSSGGDINGEGELTSTGGNVVLSDVVTDLSEIDKNKTYYFAIEYYVPTSGSNGKMVRYAIANKGENFYGANGESYITYYNTSNKEEVNSKGANVVVATKVGEKRVLNLSHFEISKTENKTSTETFLYAPTYVKGENGYTIINYLGNKGKVELPIETSFELGKEVKGTNGDKEIEWTFEIMLTGTEEELPNKYQYTGNTFINGVSKKEDGEIEFQKDENGDYVGTIKLKHGQSITIKDLPLGLHYEVTELNANSDDYKMESTNEAGVITENNVVKFENTKEFVLPKTGGIESILPILFGSIFIVFGIVLFIVSYRKKKNMKKD